MKYSNVTPDQFKAIMEEKYNRKSFRGLELRNANGDVAVTSLAYQYTTDRLTYIRSKSVEQTFYEVSPAEYADVIPGEGAFAQTIITNLTFKTAGGFTSGKLDTGKGNARLNTAEASIAPQYTYVRNWGLAIDYNLFDVEQAAFTGTWDLVEAKHRARKKDWDLGIQGIFFLGDTDDLTNFPGLFTNSVVNIDTTTIPVLISKMTYTQFGTFVGALLGVFLANAQQTVWPNTFVIPQDDYAGLMTPINPQYPNISMLSYLQQAFDKLIPSGKFKILPSAYGIGTYNAVAGINHHRYILYRRDIDTLFMELPVDYQVTAAGTNNNFQWQDVAYGQYCGVTILKPLEVMYFDVTP